MIFGLPVHEWAHAWSAYRMGDDTAALQGRLSLNPLAHLDLVGSIMLLLTGFGWARPVPVNPYRMQVPIRKGMALSAFAGPAANLVMAMLCAIPFRLGLLHLSDVYVGGWHSLAFWLWGIANINLGLAIFNLLPFYPLDGEKVLAGLLPPQKSSQLIAFRPYSPYVLMGLLFILPYMGLDILGWLIGAVMHPLEVLLFAI